MLSLRTALATTAAVALVATPALAAPTQGHDQPRKPSKIQLKDFPKTIESGSWDTSHIQGIAIDKKRGFVYHSFTQMLVKTDLKGNVISTVSGFTGHLGDLDFNEVDGRVYGSLEYKYAKAFYIAIIDVDKMTEVGMDAERSGVVSTVHLSEVVKDFTADMDGNGTFDGDVADTADHRYGCSGIDGVSFGPAFGRKGGKQMLSVAYGIYRNVERTDNDEQVLLQYDISDWAKYEKPLTQADPHRSGPKRVGGKYFVRTGNTTYGVQNLTYDAATHQWFMGVYRGTKPEFPNRLLYVVDGNAKPRLKKLVGQEPLEYGMSIPLSKKGLRHPSGIRGFEFKADVGIEPIGNGYFYVVKDFDDLSSGKKKEAGTLELHKWTGKSPAGFEPVDRVGR